MERVWRIRTATNPTGLSHGKRPDRASAYSASETAFVPGMLPERFRNRITPRTQERARFIAFGSPSVIGE